MRGASAEVLVGVMLAFLAVTAVVFFYYGSSSALIRSQETASQSLETQYLVPALRLVSAWGEFNADTNTAVISFVVSLPDGYSGPISYVIQSLRGVTLSMGSVDTASCSSDVCTFTFTAKLQPGEYVLMIPGTTESVYLRVRG